jgi:hypothetical protein
MPVNCQGEDTAAHGNAGSVERSPCRAEARETFWHAVVLVGIAFGSVLFLNAFGTSPSSQIHDDRAF